MISDGNMKCLILFVFALLGLVASSTTAMAALVPKFTSSVSDLNGHHYVVFERDDSGYLTWSGARDEAVAAGGYLATSTSETEEAFLQNVFAGAVIGQGITAWIGLSDAELEGQFHWVTGPETGQTLSYSNWRTGEPSASGGLGNEDYVTWANYPLGPTEGAWNDVAENELVKQLLVEFDPVLEFQSSPNPDNGHTYAIYRAGSFENPISLLGAKNAATLLGGYLATITSEGEENFVQQAFAGAEIKIGVNAWIGLSDEIEEGVFRWITGPDAGQLATYFNWRDGEPNNTGGIEDFVTWANYPLGPEAGAWNDVRSDERIFRFMVEFEPVPAPPILTLLGIGLLGLLASRAEPKHATK
jgi:hypothetical protein